MQHNTNKKIRVRVPLDRDQVGRPGRATRSGSTSAAASSRAAFGSGRDSGQIKTPGPGPGAPTSMED